MVSLKWYQAILTKTNYFAFCFQDSALELWIVRVLHRTAKICSPILESGIKPVLLRSYKHPNMNTPIFIGDLFKSEQLRPQGQLKLSKAPIKIVGKL